MAQQPKQRRINADNFIQTAMFREKTIFISQAQTLLLAMGIPFVCASYVMTFKSYKTTLNILPSA